MSIERIEAAYQRRGTADARYHPMRPEQLLALQQRERVLAALLRRQGRTDTATLRAAELGCGAGGNLLMLLQLGFRPEHLCAAELMPERVALARERLPMGVQLHGGDARQAPIDPGSQDLVLAFTVFSSVLDAGLQQQLADAAWHWLRPGGLALVYDFCFDNPANPEVQAVPLHRVRQLFAGAARCDSRRLTLAPPLARRLPAWALAPAHALPLLRTHRMTLLAKP